MQDELLIFAEKQMFIYINALSPRFSQDEKLKALALRSVFPRRVSFGDFLNIVNC